MIDIIGRIIQEDPELKRILKRKLKTFINEIEFSMEHQEKLQKDMVDYVRNHVEDFFDNSWDELTQVFRKALKENMVITFETPKKKEDK